MRRSFGGIKEEKRVINGWESQERCIDQAVKGDVPSLRGAAAFFVLCFLQREKRVCAKRTQRLNTTRD